MLEGALEDWFYEVKKLRPRLEAAALAEVKRWGWMKGLTCPLDPEPYRWQRGGFSLARAVKVSPGEDGASRKGHFECGLDAHDRLVVQRQYWGGPAPYVELFFSLPDAIRAVRLPDVEYDFTPPLGVRELRLEHGRVVEKASYANSASWPRRALTADDIAQLKAAPPPQVSVLHERFIWEEGRLVRAEIETVSHEWAATAYLDYKPNGALLRVWRPNHTHCVGQAEAVGREVRLKALSPAVA